MFSSVLRKSILLLYLLLLVSCAYDIKNGYNINTKDHIQTSKSDSNKRYIVAKRRHDVFENISSPGHLLLYRHQGYEDPDIVCAEPSPDTITVHSSSFGGELGVDVVSESGKVAFEKALSQTASQLRRSQTIQFLRDAHYNACQAYLNGAISKSQYNRKLDKYADEALVLFAIQQITPQDNSAITTVSSPSLPPAKAPSTPASAFSNTSTCSKQCKAQYSKNFSNYSACFNGCVAQNNVYNKGTKGQENNKQDSSNQNDSKQLNAQQTDKVTQVSPLQPTTDAINAVSNLVGRLLSQQLLNSCIEAAINNTLTTEPLAKVHARI